MLSLKTTGNVNVPVARNEQKKLISCWHFESHRQKEKDPESSVRIRIPYQNVTDSEQYFKNKLTHFRDSLGSFPDA
jgi:hypothetical protein